MKKLLAALCGTLAAAALFGIMGLTLVDVLGRKLLSASVPGSLEITELLMVAVIFSALPLVSLQAEHVVFDSLDHKLPAAVRRVQRFLVDLLCLVLLAGLAWVMWGKAAQMASYGDTTAQLKLPIGPMVYAMSVLCGLSAAVHAALMLRPADAPEAGATA